MAVSRKRLWKRVVLGVFGLLALLILVAPWIGAPILRSAAVSRLQEALGRTVELDGLDVGWTSGVTVEGLRIFNSSIEFTDSVLLEIKSARLAQPLTDLLFGSDELHLELDEVTLRLEEQAGGRTNFNELHEFLTKFREPRPAPAVVEKPEPPRPVRITLRNCAVTLRRLAPRGKLPSFDSKTGDPEILAAGEGTTVVGVEEFNLDAHLRGSSFSVELSGKTIVDDSHGSIELSLRREGKETHASIHADALDLRALAPLLPFDLEGVVDIEAHGTFLDNRISDIALKSELKGFRMKGEGIPEVREEWIRVEAKAASRKKRLEIESLVALTASKRIEIRGSGSVPLEMEAGETRFRLKGHVPLPLLYGFLDEGAVQGRVDFSLDGSSQDNVLHVSGRIDGSDLALPEADLGAPLPATVKGRLQADIAFEKKTLDLSELTISAEDSVIGVTGRAGWTEGIVVDMAVVENSRLDLGRLFPFIQPYLKLRGSPKLKGRASIKEATVKIARDGHLTLAADLLVRDFDAAGILKRRVRTKRAHLDLEATLLPGWDTIEIKRARLNDISAKGTVEGLKERPKLVEGRVEGTVPLTPVLLDLLELKDVSDIGGSLTLDLKATRGDEGATTLTGSASVTDLRLVTTAGTFAQKSLVFTPTLALVDERIKGSGTLKGDDFDLTLKNLDTGTPRSVNAELKAADLAALVPLLPPGTLPEGLEIAGDATINLLVKGPSFKVSLLSDELTVATKDRGIQRRAFQLDAHVEQAGSRWTIRRFYAASPGSPFEVTLEKGYVDHLEDAKRRKGELTVVLKSSVEILRELVPESFRDLESGTVNGNLRITLQDELRVVGKIRGTELKSKDPTKAKSKSATATLDLVGPRWISEGARPEGATGKFDVNRFDLVVNEEGDDVGRAQVTGNIDFGAEVVANLHLVVDIRMEDITTFYSAIQGEGRVTIDARVKELYDAYTKKVVSRIKGTLKAPDVRVGEIELKEPSGKFNIVSFRQGGTWTEGSSEIDVRSGTLRYGKHVAQGVVVEQ